VELEVGSIVGGHLLLLLPQRVYAALGGSKASDGGVMRYSRR
jgi:hypothetical protein